MGIPPLAGPPSGFGHRLGRIREIWEVTGHPPKTQKQTSYFWPINRVCPKRVYLGQLIDFRTIRENNCLRAKGLPIQLIGRINRF